ncbi:MAG: hypothetical protein DMF71_08430 [Acidobacteria bacterium]|nr:MAG: hypothetical protein DMF71_08430 [Acidobacteriota bacterium]
MSFSLVQKVPQRGLPRMFLAAGAVLVLALSVATAIAQRGTGQSKSDLSDNQRLDIMRSKLEAMRRTLDNAIAATNAKDSGDKQANPEDPRERLRGLDKEVGSVLSEVSDLKSKSDRAEKFDRSRLDGLETSV